MVHFKPWRTFDRVTCEEIANYNNKRVFRESSINKRRMSPRIIGPSDLHDGLCFGAALGWLRLLFARPDEAPLDRVTRLVGDEDRSVASQFLHLETYKSIPRHLKHKSQHGRYLEAMCRVSRLKFDFVSTCDTFDHCGIERFLLHLKAGHIFFLDMIVKNKKGEEFGHTANLAVGQGDKSSKFFDYLEGEITVEQHRLSQFLNDFVDDWRYCQFEVDHIHAYEVTQFAESWPHKQLVVTRHRPPPPPGRS